MLASSRPSFPLGHFHFCFCSLYYSWNQVLQVHTYFHLSFQVQGSLLPGVGAPPFGLNAPPLGFNAPPLGLSAPPLGLSAPPLGHSAPPRWSFATKLGVFQAAKLVVPLCNIRRIFESSYAIVVPSCRQFINCNRRVAIVATASAQS